MIDGITVQILGDSAPFSRMGKSIGYLVTIGESSYLIDCGAPLFQQLGGHAVRDLKGIIITHCHDDHKRWFSDIAIFYKYATDIFHKMPLIASEAVHNEVKKSAQAALDRSLSDDSKRVIDIEYDEYVDYKILGPRAKYRIAAEDEKDGNTSLRVVDGSGVPVGPDTAKIIISGKTGRPRMLFRDPDYNEWIEPESFYPFSSDVFYEEEKNAHRSSEGFSIEAINAPIWHGIPNIGIKITTSKETLIFSSDTVHDLDIWKQLYTKKRPQRLYMPKKEFEAMPVIYGDINDYIERTWSEERYREAAGVFKDAVVIHDVAVRDPVVHTSYCKLDKTNLKKDKTILTHSPDMITSEWVLSKTDKKIKIIGDGFFEIVGNEFMPMNADIYHKENGRYYVGYKNEDGNYTVYSNNGILSLSAGNGVKNGRALFNVDLYEDLTGRYFPKSEEAGSMYMLRDDGKVELVRFTEDGSRGSVAQCCRKKLLRDRAALKVFP
ncbi:MAG: MBL fold metallo-hydrolase [Nitrospirae bacterium]|nr:MBL fold metallo-hydrolase [Nitrospirota bacterium]